MIEDGLMLANLQGVSVHTLATMAMILFGNILPAGVILTLVVCREAFEGGT